MKWNSNLAVRLALALFLAAFSLPCPGAEVPKGIPETPTSAAVIAGNYICHDGNAYRVFLTLHSNGTYSAKGSSCLKNKGDASGTGTWQLSGRKVVLAPIKEEGWMNKEPKVFDVLKFQGDWIFVRADSPDYYNEHGVTDASCFQKEVPKDSYSPVSDEELPALKPFAAVVEQKAPCAACLKTSDGKRIRIGGPGSRPEVARFVQTLKEGYTYQFPKAYLEYRESEQR